MRPGSTTPMCSSITGLKARIVPRKAWEFRVMDGLGVDEVDADAPVDSLSLETLREKGEDYDSDSVEYFPWS